MAQTESAREIFGGSRETEAGVGLRLRLRHRLNIVRMVIIMFWLRLEVMTVLILVLFHIRHSGFEKGCAYCVGPKINFAKTKAEF